MKLTIRVDIKGLFGSMVSIQIPVNYLAIAPIAPPKPTTRIKFMMSTAPLLKFCLYKINRDFYLLESKLPYKLNIFASNQQVV